PGRRARKIDRRAHQQCAEVVLLLPVVARRAHPLAAHQGGEATFHPAAVTRILLLEIGGLLALTRSLCLLVVWPQAQRAAALLAMPHVAARAERAGITIMHREDRLVAAVLGRGEYGRVPIGTTYRAGSDMDVEIRLREAIRQLRLRRDRLTHGAD